MCRLCSHAAARLAIVGLDVIGVMNQVQRRVLPSKDYVCVSRY
jgi:hypothetical protein